MSDVSVIIPARNASVTIARTIDSLAADRSLIGEILLVDDSSTDETSRLATEAARRIDLPLTVIEGNFHGAGASRNAGIARAKGRYLYFLDADDEVVGNGIGTLVACLEDHPGAGMAIGGYIRRKAGHLDKVRLPRGYEHSRSTNARNYLVNKLKSIAVGSAIIRRTAVDEIRYPETLRYDEDTLFWATLLTRTDVATIQRPVMVYNVADGRSAGRLTSEARESFLNCAVELKRLRAFGIDGHTLKWRIAWLARRIARAYIMTGDPASATRFMRIASAHPKLWRSIATLRYRARIRLAALRQ